MMQLTMIDSRDSGAVLTDRRRPGRVNYKNEHLTALLRVGGTLVEPINEKLIERTAELVFDQPARWAYGVPLTMVISILLWALIITGARAVFW